MFKIGDFSKLVQVTVKALHLYDEIGLLKPARVDPENGYRYYSAEQIPRVNRILVFKNLGFTLEQVALMLDGGVNAEQIREMLLARRSQLESQLRSESEKLALVEARLRLIENKGEDIMSQHEVLIKSVEPVTVYAVREIIPDFPAVGNLFKRVWKEIGAAGGWGQRIGHHRAAGNR